MKTALYIRVSTLDQNTAAQRAELEAYAARHQWPVVGVYEDKASGADPNRPELARLLADCRAGRIECVLVWKLDRFGRSLYDCLGNLRVLEDELVRFVSMTDGVDTDRNNPAAKLFLHILAVFAECERGLIRERCLSGFRRYQEDYAAGKVGKSVHSQSGKDLPPTRPKKILDGNRILALREEGLSWRQIAAEVGESVATVHRRFKKAVSQKVGSGKLHSPAAKSEVR